MEDASVRQIVNTWIHEFDARSEWELNLISGTAPTDTDYGTYRIVRLTVNGKFDTLLDERQWLDIAKNDYRASSSPSSKFLWKPGQNIQIAMDGERLFKRAGYRPVIFSKPFDGPAALWLMSRWGRVNDDKRGSLTFEILKCPGPP